MSDMAAEAVGTEVAASSVDAQQVAATIAGDESASNTKGDSPVKETLQIGSIASAQEELVGEKVEVKELEQPPVQVKLDQKSSDPRQNDNHDWPNKKRKYDNRSKFDPSVLPESDDPDEIRKQVEFYFSDSNLPTDNFLFTQVGGSENKPIPIKVIHSFKRMRHFQPYSAVVAALKESDFLEVTEHDEVRRRRPLDPSIGKSAVENVRIFEDKAQPRSIYAKGFGKEDPSTQFDIEAFFMPYGPINAIRLRRSFPEKTFKGSVFVEFDSEETQQAFLALSSKPKWNGEELQIMSKQEYVEKKAQDIRDGKIKANEPRQNFQQSTRGRGRGRGGKNFGGRDRKDRDLEPGAGRDKHDWRSRRDDFQKNGFKDKHGRDKKKEHHQNGEHEKKNGDSAPKPRFDSRGVPVIETEYEGTLASAESAAGNATEATGPQSKKRERDEDIVHDGGDSKKVRVTEEGATP